MAWYALIQRLQLEASYSPMSHALPCIPSSLATLPKPIGPQLKSPSPSPPQISLNPPLGPRMLTLHLLQHAQQRLLLLSPCKMLPTHRNRHARRDQPRRRAPVPDRNPAQPLHYRLERGAEARQRGDVAGAQARDVGVVDREENPRQFYVLDPCHGVVGEVPDLWEDGYTGALAFLGEGWA